MTGEQLLPVTRSQFQDSTIGKALSAGRSKAAGDFKDPQHQGQRGCDWDAGFIAACRIVEANTFAIGATPTALPGAEDALREQVAGKRRSMGWSLRDLESETGIGFSTLARFERGERIGNRVRAHLTEWVKAALQSPRASDEVRPESDETYMVKRLNEGGLKHVSGSQTMLAAEFARYEAERASDEALGEASGAKCAGCGVSGHTWQDCPRNAANGVRASPVPVDASGIEDCPQCTGDDPAWTAADCPLCDGSREINTAPVADAQAKEGD